MKAPKKFSFKKHKKEGKWRSFQQDFTDLNVKEGCIGSIFQQGHAAVYRISLRVVDPMPENCPWKNITLVAQWSSEQEARDWLNEHITEIFEKYDIYPLVKD